MKPELIAPAIVLIALAFGGPGQAQPFSDLALDGRMPLEELDRCAAFDDLNGGRAR